MLYDNDIPEELVSTAMTLLSAWDENEYQQSNCVSASQMNMFIDRLISSGVLSLSHDDIVDNFKTDYQSVFSNVMMDCVDTAQIPQSK